MALLRSRARALGADANSPCSPECTWLLRALPCFPSLGKSFLLALAFLTLLDSGQAVQEHISYLFSSPLLQVLD